MTQAQADAQASTKTEPAGLAIGFRIAAAQLALTAVGASVWGVIQGWQSAGAAAAGGFVAIVATVFFTVRAFMPSGDDPSRMLGNLIRAMMVKWAVILALFIFVIMAFGDRLAPVATVFAACWLMFLPALGWARDWTSAGRKTNE